MFSKQLSITHLDMDDVKQGLADGTMLIVDVRESHEFAAGHIPDSLSLPLSHFDVARLEGHEDKRLVFSCAAGVRSIKALELAQAAGMSLHEHYRGGFKEWSGMGEQVEV